LRRPQPIGGADAGGAAIVSYSVDDLKKFGLPPLYVGIRRIGVIAKPQVNNLIDVYADMTVTSFQYAPFDTDKKLVKPIVDLDTRTDPQSDPLLTGAWLNFACHRPWC
jgi:hypothetical protein